MKIDEHSIAFNEAIKKHLCEALDRTAYAQINDLLVRPGIQYSFFGCSIVNPVQATPEAFDLIAKQLVECFLESAEDAMLNGKAVKPA